MKKSIENLSKSLEFKALFFLILGIIINTALFMPVQAADFVQNATCGLTNPAFTETFNVAYPGGKGADLDETKWSVSRWANFVNTYFTYPQADIPACKQGAPSRAWPGDEILVCDNSIPGYSGRLMTPIAGQNYGLTAFRANQPFDFAGRTGAIAFDVDAWVAPVCDAAGHWASMMLTDDPIPAPNFPYYEHSGAPRNGFILCFAGPRPGLAFGHAFHNYIQTDFNLTDGVTYQAGSLNHFEVRISQTLLEVWGTDYSTDGKTFPNFKKIASYSTINLPFTRGYVSFGVNNHSTSKYGCCCTGIHYWDNIAFDGPVVPADRVYAVPEPRTMYDASNMNLGYSADAQGISTCCGNGTGRIAPFTLSNVDLVNATEANIALNGEFVSWLMPDITKAGFVYRMNGGTWRTRYLTADEAASGISEGKIFSIPHLLTVPLSDLKQGNNTLELTAVGCSNVNVVNIELNIKTSGGATGAMTDRFNAGRKAPAANRIVFASERLAFSCNAAGKPGLINLYDVKGARIGQTMQGPDGAVYFKKKNAGQKAVIASTK
jgi:hypothetical protein